MKTLNIKNLIAAFVLGLAAIAPAQATEAKSKVMVFWASWCPSCSNALGALDQLENTQQNTDFVAVNVLDDVPAEKSLEDKGYGHLHLLEGDAELAKQYGVRALPWAVVVDANGVVISSKPAIGTQQGIASQISSTLAVSQSLAFAQ